MDALRRFPLVVAWLLVVSLMPIGLAVRALAGQPSSAPSGPLQGTSTSPPAQGQHGAMVLLRVQALVPEKITLSDPAQGTVRATVLAIDKAINQIKIHTDAGQRLLLFLPPESLARLYVGAPCLLQVAPRSLQDAARAPEPAAAFW